jgi:hypothetical protein
LRKSNTQTQPGRHNADALCEKPCYAHFSKAVVTLLSSYAVKLQVKLSNTIPVKSCCKARCLTRCLSHAVSRIIYCNMRAKWKNIKFCHTPFLGGLRACKRYPGGMVLAEFADTGIVFHYLRKSFKAGGTAAEAGEPELPGLPARRRCGSAPAGL